MKSIITLVVVLSLFSCAEISRYQKIYPGELQQRDNELFGTPQPQSSLSTSTLDDGNFGLLLGLYAFSLAKNPPAYPLFYSPNLFSPFYPFDSFHQLMVYQSILDSIGRMETFKLEMEVRRIIEGMKREASKIKN